MDVEFSDMMRALGLPAEELNKGIAVGVSGGADSTALALLAHSWCEERDIPFLAIACDHGLRPESRHEAALIARRLDEKGIDCRIIALHLKPGTAIQERARTARYKAMASVMRREGIGTLAVGHHAMDQAETVAHRLANGGGTTLGLAGMVPVRVMEDALLIRPLLGCGRGALRDYLRERAMPWTEDPSNSDSKYARVRLRQALSVDPMEVSRLLDISARSLQLLGEVVEERDHLLSQAVVCELPWGASLVDASRLAEGMAAAEAVRELMHRASGEFPNADHRKLLGFASRHSTLGGAESMAAKDGLIWICREISPMHHAVPARPFMAWDNRIRLSHIDIPGCTIEALHEDSATALRRRKAVSSDIPHRILATVPCIRDANGSGISIPQLGMGMKVELGTAVRSMPRISVQERSLDIDTSRFAL